MQLLNTIGDNMLHVPNVPNSSTVTLNIGLGGSIAWGKYKQDNANHGTLNNLVNVLDAPYRVARILEWLGTIALGTDASSIKYRIVESNSELTLVVQLDVASRTMMGDFWKLSETLRQDCIAVWVHNSVNGGIGQLIGRYNFVWGYFNPEYFIHLEQDQ